MKIIADDKIPFLKGALEPFIDIEYLPGNSITKQDVIEADGLIVRTRTKCNADLLEGTKVKFIATATIGFDHIDTEYCRSKNIIWANAPGCNSGSVMQYIASVLLTIHKEQNIDLSKRVLGVVGAGNVGKKVIRLAESLGMQVVVNDPPRARNEGICGFLSIEGILREADIITLHVPLTLEGPDKTYHMVDEEFLKKINKGAYLINSSRGEVVNTNALYKALEDNKLQGAVLDVWENEPDINRELLENVFIGTPHIAGYSSDGKANGTTMAVQALSRFFDLGMDDWQPEEIPEPQEKIIACDARGKKLQDLFKEIILKTYSVREDDEKLRQDVSNFEKFRGNYPVRREFLAYEIQADNIRTEDRKALHRLGFNFTQ